MLVRLGEVVSDPEGTCQSKHLHRNGRAECFAVIWRVDEGKGCPDTGAVADGVHEGHGRSTLRRRPGNGVGDPGVDDGVLREDEDHQEEGEVSCTEVLCGHEDDEPNDADRNRIDKEPEPLLEAVAVPGVEVGVEDHEDVWWCDKEE